MLLFILILMFSKGRGASRSNGAGHYLSSERVADGEVAEHDGSGVRRGIADIKAADRAISKDRVPWGGLELRGKLS